MAAFALPTLLMGALFSSLAQQARAAGIGLGRALAVNTLGAAAQVDAVELLPEVIAASQHFVVADEGDDAWLQRLAAYTAARNQYLAAGRSVRATSDPRGMLAQVQRPLLAVLQTSPTRPAREPLLQRSDPAAAQVLLDALAGSSAGQEPDSPQR